MREQRISGQWYVRYNGYWFRRTYAFVKPHYVCDFCNRTSSDIDKVHSCLMRHSNNTDNRLKKKLTFSQNVLSYRRKNARLRKFHIQLEQGEV